jgi:release factor glutamine methyltransferase
VTASDISTRVTEALQANARSNAVELNIIYSDLFDQIPVQTFDLIAINPPYYPKQPRNELEQAWYCGENHEYFEKLFSQIRNYLGNNSKILMVLSEDCNLDTIFSIAHKNNFVFQEESRKKFWMERNIIYSIR